MNLKLIVLISSILALFSLKISAQSPDLQNPISETDSLNIDSLATLNIKYGVKTTIHFYEQEILEHRYDTNFTDTLLHNFHRYNFLQKNKNQYQDLGGMGSATTPIYYQFPKTIGTRLGYNSFDTYLIQPTEMKYFNTMSPYSEIDFAQGSVGRTKLKVTVSRNVNPDWNFTVQYRKIQQNEVFAGGVRQNETWASNEVFAGNMSWWSRNHRYKLLTNLTHYEHITNDFGGYKVADTVQNLKELFEVDNNAQLEYLIDDGVGALQTRQQWHLYHQFALFDSSTVQIFHILNRSSQMNRQRDANYKIHNLYDTLYFDENLLTNPAVNYQTEFNIFENQIGLKGQIGDTYYQGYARLKQYEFSTQHIYPENSRDTTTIDQIEDELFVGGMLRLNLSKDNQLSAKAQYLLTKNNDYQINVKFKNKFLEANYQRFNYGATLIQNRFYGGFFEWGKTQSISENTTAERYDFHLDLNFSSVSFCPYISYTSLKHYVYFDSLALPQQHDKNIQILQVGLDTEFRWRKYRTELDFLYTANSATEIIRMPDFQITGKIYRNGKLFRSQRTTQVGLDFHYKSAYLADAFMPATQQFYLQNRFEVENYLNIDLFFNLQIKSFLMFLKVNNLTEGLIGQGYYTTPVYFAQQRGFEVGVKWRFFD